MEPVNESPQPTVEIKPATPTVAVKVTNLDAPSKFGPNQIGKTTPPWATWTFRIFFYITSFGTIVLTSVKKIPAETVVEILFWVGISNIFVHGMSKMVGIDSKKIEMEAKEAFNLTAKQ